MTKKLSTHKLQEIRGGGIPTPSWNQLLNSICGFFDGLSGSKNHGHC